MRSSSIMTDLTYESLQREAARWLLRDAFVRGPGGPLVFVWAVGTALSLGAWSIPHLAALWTLASFGLAGLTVRDYRRSPSAREASTRFLLEARYPRERPADPRHQAAVHRGSELFLELLRKLADIQQAHELEEDLVQSVTDMDRLLALQFESARQVEEIERVLRLIKSDQESAPEGGAGPARNRPGDANGIHRRNVEAITRERQEADDLVEVIGQREETLLLQVVQMERRAIDLVTSAETRTGSAEALERLQQIVDARRAAAAQLIELVAPELAGSAP
jgi:hypothetical protein